MSAHGLDEIDAAAGKPGGNGIAPPVLITAPVVTSTNGHPSSSSDGSAMSPISNTGSSLLATALVLAQMKAEVRRLLNNMKNARVSSGSNAAPTISAMSPGRAPQTSSPIVAPMAPSPVSPAPPPPVSTHDDGADSAATPVAVTPVAPPPRGDEPASKLTPPSTGEDPTSQPTPQPPPKSDPPPNNQVSTPPKNDLTSNPPKKADGTASTDGTPNSSSSASQGNTEVTYDKNGLKCSTTTYDGQGPTSANGEVGKRFDAQFTTPRDDHQTSSSTEYYKPGTGPASKETTDTFTYGSGTTTKTQTENWDGTKSSKETNTDPGAITKSSYSSTGGDKSYEMVNNNAQGGTTTSTWYHDGKGPTDSNGQISSQSTATDKNGGVTEKSTSYSTGKIERKSASYDQNGQKNSWSTTFRADENGNRLTNSYSKDSKGTETYKTESSNTKTGKFNDTTVQANPDGSGHMKDSSGNTRTRDVKSKEYDLQQVPDGATKPDSSVQIPDSSDSSGKSQKTYKATPVSSTDSSNRTSKSSSPISGLMANLTHDRSSSSDGAGQSSDSPGGDPGGGAQVASAAGGDGGGGGGGGDAG